MGHTVNKEHKTFHFRLVVGICRSMCCDQKSFMQVWWSHELPSGFLANGNLPKVSGLSDEKGNKEVKPETAHSPPDLCLTNEENPGKHVKKQFEDCATSHHPKWGPLLPNDLHMIRMKIVFETKHSFRGIYSLSKNSLGLVQ